MQYPEVKRILKLNDYDRWATFGAIQRMFDRKEITEREFDGMLETLNRLMKRV